MFNIALTNITYYNGELYVFYRDHNHKLKYYRTKYSHYIPGTDIEHSYIINNINILKTKIRYIFIDIEIMAPEFPDPINPKYPIVNICLYDNYTDKIYNFWLPDYQNENEMISNVFQLIKSLSPDLIIGWNIINFDYLYLANRHEVIQCSPIDALSIERIPVGISILDYMLIDKKITANRKKSYSLEQRAYEEISYPLSKKVDFSTLNNDIKEKCIDDVKRMIELEKKLHYIELCNNIRIFSKCLWKDLYYNSKIIDQLLLQEANKLHIKLPGLNYEEKTKQQKNKFEGAFRKAFKTGLFKQVNLYDLSSAYLHAIIDLYLDPYNLLKYKTKDALEITITDRLTNKPIKTIYIKQNPNSPLVTLAKKLIQNKIQYKQLLSSTNPNDPNYTQIEILYNAIKSIFLSAWGVIGNFWFRLYNNDISSAITSSIRDLLHYIINKLKEQNIEILYVDTDSILVNTNKDILNMLNNLIQSWSIEKYNKKSSIFFEYKGTFESIIIIDECRYAGFLKTEFGVKEEIKGLEIKRKDSSVFMAKFQKELLYKIMLDNYNYEQTLKFIKQKILEMKSSSLLDISFPASISRDMNTYKTKVTNKFGTTYIRKPPIFIQAYLNTSKDYNDFNKNNFYYLYTKNNVPYAINEDILNEVKLDIDWNKMIERNIVNKAEVIFKALSWRIDELLTFKNV